MMHQAAIHSGRTLCIAVRTYDGQRVVIPNSDIYTRAVTVRTAFPTRVVLLHDQTEGTDGIRTRQREGWPAGDRPPGPRHLNPVAVRHAACPECGGALRADA